MADNYQLANKQHQQLLQLHQQHQLTGSGRGPLFSNLNETSGPNYAYPLEKNHDEDVNNNQSYQYNRMENLNMLTNQSHPNHNYNQSQHSQFYNNRYHFGANYPLKSSTQTTNDFHHTDSMIGDVQSKTIENSFESVAMDQRQHHYKCEDISKAGYTSANCEDHRSISNAGPVQLNVDYYSQNQDDNQNSHASFQESNDHGHHPVITINNCQPQDDHAHPVYYNKYNQLDNYCQQTYPIQTYNNGLQSDSTQHQQQYPTNDNDNNKKQAGSCAEPGEAGGGYQLENGHNSHLPSYLFPSSSNGSGVTHYRNINITNCDYQNDIDHQNNQPSQGEHDRAEIEKQSVYSNQNNTTISTTHSHNYYYYHYHHHQHQHQYHHHQQQHQHNYYNQEEDDGSNRNGSLADSKDHNYYPGEWNQLASVAKGYPATDASSVPHESRRDNQPLQFGSADKSTRTNVYQGGSTAVAKAVSATMSEDDTSSPSSSSHYTCSINDSNHHNDSKFLEEFSLKHQNNQLTVAAVAAGAAGATTSCSSSSSSRSSLSSTTSTSASLSRVNKCSICGRNYARPSTLKTHLRTHTNERPFKCNVCHKTFSQAANLTAHQRVHTGERPFSCPLCGRQFSQSSSVITHLRTHSGERPYRCNICNRTFSDSSTLTKHCRIHSGEKPYQCNYCPLNFSQSGNLSRHLKLHFISSSSSSSSARESPAPPPAPSASTNQQDQSFNQRQNRFCTNSISSTSNGVSKGGNNINNLARVEENTNRQTIEQNCHNYYSSSSILT